MAGDTLNSRAVSRTSAFGGDFHAYIKIEVAAHHPLAPINNRGRAISGGIGAVSRLGVVFS